MHTQEQAQTEILAQWGWDGADCYSLGGGHINTTYKLERAKQRAVLQRVNPIFAPELHFDIDAITRHLASQGLLTPRLIETRSNKLWHVDAEGCVWRLMTYVDGRTLLAVDGPQRSQAAARMLGHFHRALHNCEHTFHFTRPGVHAVAQHIDTLQLALQQHAQHRHFDQIAKVAQKILGHARTLDLDAVVVKRIVHGDPKISNILFAHHSDDALCLVDLDTLAKMPLAFELGDAFRSWCNPAGEEDGARFELSLFDAAVATYCQSVVDVVAVDEIESAGVATLAISIELSARFCADALNEKYFKWDASRFGSAAEHNLQRARSQLCLAESIISQRVELEASLQRALKSLRTR